MKRIAERQIQREDGDDPHAVVDDAATDSASTQMSREAAPRVIRGLPKRKGLMPSPSAPALSANPFAQLAPTPSPESPFGNIQLTSKSSKAPCAPQRPAPLPTSVSHPALPSASKPAPAAHNELEYWKGVRGLNWSMARHFVQVWNASDELADLHATLVQFAAAYREHHEALASKWLGHALEAPIQTPSTSLYVKPAQAASTETTSSSTSKVGLPSSGPSKPAFSFGDKPASSQLFSFGAEKPKASEPANSAEIAKPSFSFDTSKPATSEPAPVKPSFSFGTLNKPSFSNTESAKPSLFDTSKPAFTGAATESTGMPESLSANGPKSVPSVTSTNETKPTSFGAKDSAASEAVKDKPAFSFGAKDSAASEAVKDKPAFSFGAKDSAASEPVKDKPAFTFGAKDNAASDTFKDKPAFSFGAKDKPAVSFDAPSSTPSFSFGTSNDQPTLSFGQSAPSNVLDIGRDQVKDTNAEDVHTTVPPASLDPTASQDAPAPVSEANGAPEHLAHKKETACDKAPASNAPSTNEGETSKASESGPALKLPTLPSGGFSFAGQAAPSILKATSQNTMDGAKAPALAVPPGGFAFGLSQVKLADVSKADSQAPGNADEKVTVEIAPKKPMTPSKPTATTKPITFGSATPPFSQLPFGAAGSPPVAPHRFSFGSSPKEDKSPFTKAAIGPSFANTTGVSHGGSFQFGETPIAFAASSGEPPKEDDTTDPKP